MKKISISLALLFFSFNIVCQNITKVRAIKVDSSFDEQSSKILKIAIERLEKIFNSKEFKNEVLKAKLRIGNKGLSNSEIFELIMSGENKHMNESVDFSIDLRLRVFDNYFGSGNFGITNMTTRVTRTHRCFILENNIDCYISHLAHEYMHQIGFIDKRTWFLGKKTKSVPYKIGNIVKKILGSNSSCRAKKKTCKNDH